MWVWKLLEENIKHISEYMRICAQLKALNKKIPWKHSVKHIKTAQVQQQRKKNTTNTNRNTTRCATKYENYTVHSFTFFASLLHVNGRAHI